MSERDDAERPHDEHDDAPSNTKLTPDLIGRIAEAFEKGHTVRSAAALAGVHRVTLYRWLTRGEEDDAPQIYRDLVMRVEEARAAAVQTLIEAATRDAVGGVVIERGVRPDGTEYEKLTPPNGRVALAMLERLSDEWQPVKSVQVSGPDGGPVPVVGDLHVMSTLVERIAAARERRRAEPDDPEQVRARAVARAFGQTVGQQ